MQCKEGRGQKDSTFPFHVSVMVKKRTDPILYLITHALRNFISTTSEHHRSLGQSWQTQISEITNKNLRNYIHYISVNFVSDCYAKRTPFTAHHYQFHSARNHGRKRNFLS